MIGMDGKEYTIDGVPISSGIVLGTARVMLPGEAQVSEMPIPASRVPREIDALQKAVDETLDELREVHQAAIRKIGGPVAKIFEAQVMIASDTEFLKRVRAAIEEQRLGAAYVYQKLVQETVDPLQNSPDRYMRQVALDIEAVAARVVARLSGRIPQQKRFAPNTIVVGKS
nr:phosphoenolpyruvate-utilizing N-terminal domain-containing protein [candidate division Zixibacteria bacterium]